jgi:polyisoprenoid-binding protein YceI
MSTKVRVNEEESEMSDSTSTATIPKVGTYVVDPAHTEVGFVARHLIGTKVRGRFTEVQGTFTVAERPEESTLDATVEAASIHTNQGMRDDHLRTNDFLDVANHPKITLKSTSFKRVDDAHWIMRGELTIRGVTKPVDFDLEFLGEGPSMQEGKTIVAFSASAEIDRRDFGVNFNHALFDGSVVVGNKVVIELEVEAGLAD